MVNNNTGMKQTIDASCLENYDTMAFHIARLAANKRYVSTKARVPNLAAVCRQLMLLFC